MAAQGIKNWPADTPVGHSLEIVLTAFVGVGGSVQTIVPTRYDLSGNIVRAIIVYNIPEK